MLKITLNTDYFAPNKQPLISKSVATEKITMLRFFLLLIFVIKAHSSSNLEIEIPKSRCSDIDVKSKMNPQLKEYFSKPIDQGSIGWCYGFSAADLISAQVGVPVSGAHVSANFNKEIESSFFSSTLFGMERAVLGSPFKDTYEGGDIAGAVEISSKSMSLCSNEEFPYDKSNYNRIKGLIKGLEGFEDSFDGDASFDMKCSRANHLKNMFKLNIDTNELLRNLEHKSVNEYLADLVESNCSNKVNVANLKASKMSRPRLRKNTRSQSDTNLKRAQKKVEKYFSKIGELLSNSKPVGISYNISSITKMSGKHASVVTGRRWKDGVCQFRVRNTWGKNCSIYERDKVIGCDYESGEFWLTDQRFLDAVSKITYID